MNFESFVFIVFDGGRWRQDLGRSLDRKRWLLIYLWSIRRSMREISSRAGTLGCQSSTVHQASATSYNFRLCITDECWRSDKSQWCHCVGCNTWCKSSENRHEKTLGARGNLVRKVVGAGWGLQPFFFLGRVFYSSSLNTTIFVSFELLYCLYQRITFGENNLEVQLKLMFALLDFVNRIIWWKTLWFLKILLHSIFPPKITSSFHLCFEIFPWIRSTVFAGDPAMKLKVQTVETRQRRRTDFTLF